MYQIISLVLAALGVVLFIAPDYLLKDVQDSNLKMIRDYHQVVGAGLVGLAYYLYSTSEKSNDISSTPSTPSETTVDLPSYEEVTSNEQ
jgi:hypothetical protein